MNKFIASSFIWSLFLSVFLYAPTPFIGDVNPGFSFSLLPSFLVDTLGQKIYVVSAQVTSEKAAAYALSGFDIPQSQESNYKFFVPLLTKNAIVNGVLEANPLYGKGFSNFTLLPGMVFEPKYYPMLVVNGLPQVFILNQLNLYGQEKNKIIATDALTDFLGNQGQVIALGGLHNKCITAVVQEGAVFGDGNDNAALYTYQVNEKIIPLQGSSDYATFLHLEQPTKIAYDNTLPALLVGDEQNIVFYPNSFSLYANQSTNSCYIAVSGEGETGIAAVTLFDKPLLSDQAVMNGNNIVMTNQPNTPLYINQLSSLLTTTNLSYLLVLGGMNTINNAMNIVYALPLINDSTRPALIGMLANVNQQPVNIFSNKAPFHYLQTVFNQEPELPGDLYTVDDQAALAPALVGQGPLQYFDGDTLFPLKINDIEGYKDTVFAATAYLNNDQKGIGGIFYSQCLFDEYGAIKAWTPWQRKNILGNILTQSYVPTLGSSIALFLNTPKQIYGVWWNEQGPFLNMNNGAYESLPLAKSGIQKVIDLPWMHPGIGVEIVSPFLKSSYMLQVGFNTVILQQTAKNNALLPLFNTQILLCDQGNAANIVNKTATTTTVAFFGGILANAGSLWTGALGYNSLLPDSWIIAAGQGGVYILADENGNGCGVSLLQSNFVGISRDLSWQRLGNFGVVKKIIAQDGMLFVMTNTSLYRVSLNHNNIKGGIDCLYDLITTVSSLSDKMIQYNSFSDVLVSESVCLLATSFGLFMNAPGSSMSEDNNFIWNELLLPEHNGAMPLVLSPVTVAGWQDNWAVGSSGSVSSNIYVLAASLSRHYSKLYRFVMYGVSDGYTGPSLKLLPNYFIKNIPTYYYNPHMEFLSFATDGATSLTHGVFGANNFFRSYIGLMNPLARQGGIALKNQFNFFELSSKMNMYIGFPTYSSGNGIWLVVGQNGMNGFC